MHPLRALRERGNNTPEEVSELLSDDIEFHTPILTKVVTGRELIGRIWALSSHVRSGHYVLEAKVDERTTFLQWQGQVSGRDLEILELIEDDDQGLIRKRIAAYRPLPAVESGRRRPDRDDGRCQRGHRTSGGLELPWLERLMVCNCHRPSSVAHWSG